MLGPERDAYVQAHPPTHILVMRGADALVRTSERLHGLPVAPTTPYTVTSFAGMGPQYIVDCPPGVRGTLAVGRTTIEFTCHAALR